MTGLVGIDFGTTNSVVSILQPDGTLRTQRFTAGGTEVETFRTLLCFWSEEDRKGASLHHSAGPFAISSYLDDPLSSRLIMSMKSYLAQRSFSQTQIFGRPFTLEALVALFLRTLLGEELEGWRVVAGRPVRFAGDVAEDDFGEARLRRSFAQAGFPEIEVALEPEAAGYRFAQTLDGPATVLIGDFGGGTSDFSVMRFTPGDRQRVTPLGHAGVGIAGDMFDYRIIDQVVSPLLGKHDLYTVMGNPLPVPPDYFSGFARWHKLSLMRAPRLLRDIAAVAATSSHPERLHTLIRLIEHEVGYQLYQAVSAAKAELSRSETALLRFSHEEFAIEEPIARADFERWIAPDLHRLKAAIDDVLARADLPTSAIDRVFLTGGTSFVPAVRRLFEDRFGGEKVSGGGEFVSVAEGLALIGRDRASQEYRRNDGNRLLGDAV
jgi:hypothetical chaperone protein